MGVKFWSPDIDILYLKLLKQILGVRIKHVMPLFSANLVNFFKHKKEYIVTG